MAFRLYLSSYRICLCLSKDLVNVFLPFKPLVASVSCSFDSCSQISLSPWYLLLAFDSASRIEVQDSRLPQMSHNQHTYLVVDLFVES